MTVPTIRVGIDWDNDGHINWGTPQYPNKATWPADKQFSLLVGLANSAPATLGSPNHPPIAMTYQASNAASNDLSDVVSRASIVHVPIYSLHTGSAHRLYVGLAHPVTPTKYASSNAARLDLTSEVGTVHAVVGMAIRTMEGSVNMGIRPFFSTNPEVLVSSSSIPAVQSTVTFTTDWTYVSVLYTLTGGSVYWLCPLIDRTTDWSGAADQRLYIADYSIHTNTAAFPASTTINYYNTGGAALGREEITNDVIDLTWRLGTDDPDKRLSDDGSGVIVLDNSQGKYTPGVGSSSVGSIMQTGVRVEIQMLRSNGMWRTMWRGLVDSIDYATDTDMQERRTRISIVSPMYRGNNQPTFYPYNQYRDNALIYFPKNMRNHFYEVIRKNDVVRPAIEPVARAQLSAVGRCVTQDSVDTTPPSLGNHWNAEMLPLTKATSGNMPLVEYIERLAQTEQGYVFTQRAGDLLFVGRKAYRDNAALVRATHTLPNMQLFAEEVSARFGERVYTSASCQYTWQFWGTVEIIPTQQTTNEDGDETDGVSIVWPRRTNIAPYQHKTMQVAFDRLGLWSVWNNVFPPLAEYERLQKITQLDAVFFMWQNGGFPAQYPVLDVNKYQTNVYYLFDAFTTVPPSGGSIILQSNTPAGATTPATNDGTEGLTYFLRKRLWNIRGDKPNTLILRGHNDGTKPAGYTIAPVAIRARAEIIGEEETWEKASPYVIDKPRLNHADIGPIVVDTAYYANRVLNMVLADNQTEHNEITQFSFTLDSTTNPMYNIFMEAELGDALLLSETTLEMDNAPHAFMGEEVNVSGGTVRVTWFTRRGGNLTVSQTDAVDEIPFNDWID